MKASLVSSPAYVPEANLGLSAYKKALRAYCVNHTQRDYALDHIAGMIVSDFDVTSALLIIANEDQVYIKANAGLLLTGNYTDCNSLKFFIQSLQKTVSSNQANKAASSIFKVNGVFNFHAAAPIVSSLNENVGMICLLNHSKRKFTATDKQKLARYAQLVTHDLHKNIALIQTSKQNKRQKKLRAKQMIIAKAQAQQYERAQIGIELHDNISQILTTVRLYNEMALAGAGDVKGLLGMSNKYLYRCIEELRSLSQQMCAPSLKGITLADLIKDLVDSINRTKETFVHYIITGLHDNAVNQEMHLVVYRVVQEQLNNIIKHAEATQVTIEIYNSKNGFQLLITDNGKGFDLTQKKCGIGLSNMQARIKKLNGIFTINSALGIGCQVHVDFPHSA